MAGHSIGIRREDKYQWERRVPLIPRDVKELVEKDRLEIVAQRSHKRIFTDGEYRQLGIEVAEDLSSCPIIVGIKEIPIPVLEKRKTYVFFSHTIKGQSYNMAMLSRMLELRCTLIDYEKVTDEDGRRLIFFGNYAGLAGMIETLWALGKRLAWEGIGNPFEEIDRALDYRDLAAAREAIRMVGKRVKDEGLPEEITPLVVGFAGYGNVSRGAQEILDLLPVREISSQDLASLAKEQTALNNVLYKVVFKEENMVKRVDSRRPFDLQEYYQHPERYRGIFKRYLAHLSVLVNAIYWDTVYPRLVTKAVVKKMYEKGQPRLRVIGDISCDVEGAIECTVKATEPGDPVYVYDPVADRAISGVEGDGPVIMAVDILPAELPREASIYFSGVLKSYIPAIAQADFTGDFVTCQLPAPIKRAVIAYRGELTPEYSYLKKYL
ncbi:TPA: hypothetical protein DIT45_02500 [Candidatus Acetothermia bacterium]|nr:hypothetical protein [Candidatus Acetothermia bacterium]